MAGTAQAAALGSTRMFPAVLCVAHVPLTPTRLLLARIKATANATQDTQVKITIRDKYKTDTQTSTCTQDPNTNTDINTCSNKNIHETLFFHAQTSNGHTITNSSPHAHSHDTHIFTQA